MLKKTTTILVLSFVLILWATPMVFGQKFQAQQIPLDQRLGPTAPVIPLEKGFCVIQNDDGSIAYYWDGFGAGDGVAAYMDPATCPDPPPYPFRITDAHFYLYNFGGAVWPVQIDVNVRDLVGGDSCNGPGVILCSETFTIPYDSSYQSLGREMNLTISPLCCVNGPFFLEIAYTGGTGSPYPSPLFGSDVADTCINWMLYGGLYYDWNDFWGPGAGNIVLRATGNTHDPDCGEPWPNHKMHFPQLPDLEGWDVFAGFPKTLADDWQCSATGPVLDIHFWGSWKDLDGDPYTDDFYTPMPWFQLSIHRNIPATPDTPWSRPGDQIWFWEGEVPGTPFEPPAMEHWLDPNTGEVFYNDHVPYWRYDFFFDSVSPPPEPFFQYQDSIYWLNISALYISTPYQWGWKSSTDHFMDDAVYTDNPPVGPWSPLIEPPRANWFDVYFNSLGEPEDMGSTNYYGAGWYRYEYWSNMWFYDNPYVTNPKHVWLEFYVDPVGPTPYIEFAINWSTDLWSIEGVPGRPPLPGEDETLYIGREIFPVSIGLNTIDFWIEDYNPEWVSIDFVATDVVINGWIWHECVQTSMDLAFVITGEEIPTGQNHFKIWLIEPQTFHSIVFVQDQFMEDSLTLVDLEFLSNPVVKMVDGDTFDIVRPDDHLTWYRAFGRDTLIEVEYVNQFESTTVVIDSVDYLLVPTQKEGHAPPEYLDHYKAYRIEDAVAFPVQLALEDQFDVLYGMPEFIDFIIPRYFLTPAIKNTEQPQLFDSVTHYVAYEIIPTRYFPLSVNTWDQFGTHVLNAYESQMLLVPSKKIIRPPCYPPNIGCPADETQNQNGVYTTTTQWTANDGNPGDPSVELISVAVQAPLPPGISAAVVNFIGPVPGPGLGVKTTWGTVTYTVADHCQSGGDITLITTNNCPAPNNSATCTFNVTLTNDPPDITQPDSLEGFVNHVVEYDISGNDPNGDIINDTASIQIVPDCGTYSITRTSGSGTSSGTWHVSWNTSGCTDSITYLVIHDLTDTCGATAYCTTKVHLSQERECDVNDPYDCDTLWVECGDMQVPPGGGLVTVDLTIANDESLRAVQVILSYQGSPVGCDSMPDSENTVDKVFAGSVVENWEIKVVNIDHAAKTVSLGATPIMQPCLPPGKGHLATLTLFGDSCCTILLDTTTATGNSTRFTECYNLTTFYPVCRIDTCHIEREEVGWHWKDPYEDYAPNGMPDIDQRQDAWIKYDTDQWSFCGPCAVANCFKWFDSKYNVPPGVPGDGIDQFPLVRQYIDPLGGMICPYDDHDPWNVDHPATSWNPGIGPPPPTVPQPFVPGAQPPGMPPWGELVERLAWYFNTDGIQTGYCEFTGTNVMWMQQGIDDWLNSETFTDGSTLADTLCEVTTPMPTFAYVESLVEKCEDVILLLGFWYEDPPGSGEWWRIGGHYVTVAGVNSEQSMIAFSDPFIDAFEMGVAPGRVGDGYIISHPHGSHDATVHNDEGNVSHDIYAIYDSPSPGGLWGLPEYAIMTDPYYWSWNFFNQNVPDEFIPMTAPWSEISPIFTEVEYCVHISPWDYRGDVNIPYGDGVVNIADVVFLVNYLFTGGAVPVPYSEGDTNCDGVVNIADVVTIINYLFAGAPAPRCCDP
jgi:hypothetical protein